jgi:hypothetical protein
VFTALALVFVTGCARLNGPTRGNLTRAGVRLSIPQVIQYAYDAGFRTERQLTIVTAIAIAESSLYTAHRHWHTEYGYRAASDPIGVEGPAWAWNSRHTQQLHSDRGLWQVSSYWWGKYSDARTDNPAAAARVVVEMSKLGTDFSPWDSWDDNHNAQRHMDSAYNGWPAVRPYVRSFLARR